MYIFLNPTKIGTETRFQVYIDKFQVQKIENEWFSEGGLKLFLYIFLNPTKICAETRLRSTFNTFLISYPFFLGFSLLSNQKSSKHPNQTNKQTNQSINQPSKMTTMTEWTENSRRSIILSPCFEPTLIDSMETGNINAC